MFLAMAFISTQNLTVYRVNSQGPCLTLASVSQDHQCQDPVSTLSVGQCADTDGPNH